MMCKNIFAGSQLSLHALFGSFCSYAIGFMLVFSFILYNSSLVQVLCFNRFLFTWVV